jgi:hypothetical protein
MARTTRSRAGVSQNRLWNLGIGVLAIVASVVTLLWWIPNDIESGVLIEDRYSVEVGDAFAPTAVAIGILVMGVLVCAAALFSRPPERSNPENTKGNTTEPRATEGEIGLSRGNVVSLTTMLAVLIGSLLLMTWAGPLTVSAMQSAGIEVKAYRLLTDTRPYKYIGFALGGFVMVLSLVTWIEGHLSLRAVLTAVGAVAALIFVYDVPFDSLLLPPNGGQ